MKPLKNEPLIPASTTLPELTLKAIFIGFLLAIILAASNAYLALKIGTTISASIPASVLAMGLLRFFKRSNVLETNIIQTAASAGEGVAAALAFILPAMIVLHIWSDFSYWQTTTVTLIGGLLGVVFSIPLRRVMLHMPALPFPEGTAIGNVLITSTQKGNFLKYLVNGGVVGGVISFCQTGLQIFSDTIQVWTYVGKNSLMGFGMGLMPATLAAGYIIGIRVGITLLVGIIIGWLIVLPSLAAVLDINHGMSAYDVAMSIWSTHLRFVGVGTMLVGGVWTLLRLLQPVFEGLKISFLALRHHRERDKLPLLRTEKDISILWVVNLTIGLSIIFYIVFYYIMTFYNVHPQNTLFLLFAAFCTLLYVIIIGFLLATVCAYFTGLVGSTNNPLSGILIIALILLSLLYMILFDLTYSAQDVSGVVVLVAAVVATIASISNENLQDLKAGYMVGATPWKQQLMLGIGVIATAIIIGPVLNLLFHAYGMAGVFPRAGMDTAQMLPAPQASLISAVIKGVLTHHLKWNMIFLGAGIAVVIIFVDEWLRKRGYSLPCLAVGLAIYLPSEIITPIVIGGLMSYLVNHFSYSGIKDVDNIHDSKQRGILLACGMVAGSALMGVLLAIPFVIMGDSNALQVMPAFLSPLADVLGVVIFLLLCIWFYRTACFRVEKL